ncbi:MAG: hypothetical protein H8E32_05880 [Nitrospinae bacterium]|nr:hypothetical protein [Nitrospinota bacterium]
MTLEIAELNLQGTPREQRSSSAAVSASVSSELNIRTQEGDLVNLSFSSEQSLQESRTQTRSQEFGSFQEISTIAKAASNYSISVQGDLNEEELAAINKLAAEISPIASEFFANGGFDFENSGNVLADNLGVIQEVELNLQRTIVATFATRTVTQLPEEGFSPEDIEAALSNPTPSLETEGIRDFPALVQATFDAVFEAEAAEVPKTDPILRSLNDLLDFIRQRLGDFFGPESVELPPEAPVPSDGAADIVAPSNPESAQ